MWILYALLASMFWGLVYAIDGRLFKFISIQTTLSVHFITLAITFVVASVFTEAWKQDLAVVKSNLEVQQLLIFGTITFIVAEFMIAYSIFSKNATLAGLIEVSYPIFIALFSYFLFKEQSPTISTIAGGLLILSGVVVVYLQNP